MKEESFGLTLSLDIDDVREALQNALPIAEYFAKLTTTLWDDEAVQVINAIVKSDKLMDWLRRILGEEAVIGASGMSRTTLILEAASDAATQDVREELEAAGLSWTTLLANAPAIIALVLTIMGKRR